MEKENPYDTHRDEKPQIVTRRLSVINRPEDDKHQKSKRNDHTGKTQFFTNHRENEIRMAGWQETQLVLRAVENTLADQPPGTDCNLGLRNLITLAQRIPLRIEEGQNTFLLVRLQNEPRNRKDENKREKQRNQSHRSHAAHEQSDGNRRQERK